MMLFKKKISFLNKKELQTPWPLQLFKREQSKEAQDTP